MKTYDAIVVGVGGMGSAAVYHLARRGARVLGLEQFDIPHELGSSHGATRIIRLAYAEHPKYVPLLKRAYALWRELERRAGETLLLTTGGIDAGPAGSTTVTGALRSCRLHHLPHEILGAAALRRRFPGFRLSAGMLAVHQPDAGILFPERCIVAHATAALTLGADIHARERVISWRDAGRWVTVSTDKDRYRTKKLVIAAGPWARMLVPALQHAAVPERQVTLWVQPRRPAVFRPERFPVFNMETALGRFYGFPVCGLPGFKIGKYNHRREQVADPDRMDRTCHPADEAVLRAGIRRYFPDADGPTLGMKACIFTNSPDEHFIIDVLPDAPRVALAAGFSGHGFKFAAVVGEIMAELALDGGSHHDIRLFRLDRAAIRTHAARWKQRPGRMLP